MDFESIAKGLDDYLEQKGKDLSSNIATVDAKDQGSPVGKVKSDMQKKTADAVLNSVKSGPIEQAAAGFVSSVATNLSSQLVKNVFTKNNIISVDNAVQGLFQALAMAKNLGAEFAVEMARNSAGQILKYLDEKDAIVSSIRSKLVSLHNACTYLSGNPFVKNYIQDLIKAIDLLDGANQDFGQVAIFLGSPTSPTFHSAKYDQGLSKLLAAQSLISPGSLVDISNVKQANAYASGVVKSSSDQTKAAVLVVPAISLEIGQLIIKYVRVVTNINLSITSFLGGMDAWTSTFKNSTSVYKAMLAHLQTGRSSISSLTSDMRSAIYPADGVTSGSLYSAKLNASASTWGLRNQTIIEWMRLNPGVLAAQSLNNTSTGIEAYKTAMGLIKDLKDLSYVGGTFIAGTGKEDPNMATKNVARLLLKVNTMIAKNQFESSVTIQFKYADAFFNTSITNSQRLRSILKSFASTKSALPTPARQFLLNQIGWAREHGLDRAAMLLMSGDMLGILSITSVDATTEGATYAALSSLIDVVKQDPNASDAQVERLESARSEVEADKISKEVEAGRVYGSSADAARDKLNAKMDKTKTSIGYGVETAKELDKSKGQTDTNYAENAMASSVPGFNNNKTLSGVL